MSIVNGYLDSKLLRELTKEVERINTFEQGSNSVTVRGIKYSLKLISDDIFQLVENKSSRNFIYYPVYFKYVNSKFKKLGFK